MVKYRYPIKKLAFLGLIVLLYVGLGITFKLLADYGIIEKMPLLEIIDDKIVTN